MIVTGPSRSTEVYGEVPAGPVNGVNATFLTAFAFRTNSERLYLNGVRQKRVNDYTVIPPTTLVFVLAPRANDHVLVDYLR
jgi:hypothetical protein